MLVWWWYGSEIDSRLLDSGNPEIFLRQPLQADSFSSLLALRAAGLSISSTRRSSVCCGVRSSVWVNFTSPQLNWWTRSVTLVVSHTFSQSAILMFLILFVVRYLYARIEGGSTRETQEGSQWRPHERVDHATDVAAARARRG